MELGFALRQAIVLAATMAPPRSDVSVDLTTPAGHPDLPHWSKKIDEAPTTTVAPGAPPLILRQTYEPGPRQPPDPG